MSHQKAYPLKWPDGWIRALPHKRIRAKFGTVEAHLGARKVAVTVTEAVRRVRHELSLMAVGKDSVVISSNLEFRQERPVARRVTGGITDPGVAVYWLNAAKESRCMAIDRYESVAGNLAAIAATLSAMRSIERHGGAEILDRAFANFIALPAPEQWWQVLGLEHSHASAPEIVAAHRRLSWDFHPDRIGGDDDLQARINRARDQGLEQFTP